MVIVGAGFGGLWAARSLAKEPLHALIVDRNNYHTFPALLYQVAAAELEAEDIAYPVRSILWKFPNVNFALAHYSSFQPHRFPQPDDGTHHLAILVTLIRECRFEKRSL